MAKTPFSAGKTVKMAKNAIFMGFLVFFGIFWYFGHFYALISLRAVEYQYLRPFGSSHPLLLKYSSLNGTLLFH